MKKKMFYLSTEQLKEIALELQAEVEKGLEKDNQEVQCIPTYINPNTAIDKGKALVLDLGGTNYRAAIVEFSKGKAVIHPQDGLSKKIKDMKTKGYTRDKLFKEIADLISELKLDGITSIGYCFSYPAESTLDGDANLVRWTKGVDIKDMLNKPVGNPLMEYLNKNLKTKFTDVKVINDTVASLFAGLTDKKADAHIGLIVGTGTNMATFIHSDKIAKLNPKYTTKGLVPINLESGNFEPSYLNVVDNKVDKGSDVKGAQRFEKAVSGMYLGEILKYVFSCDEFEESFDAQKLTHIMNYPDMYKTKYVQVARQIYKRSAQLVAASIAGLILVMVSHDSSIKKVRLTAEGSLFWSDDRKGEDYNVLVMDETHRLLGELGHGKVKVFVDKMDNANLIGSAIAALS